MIPSLSQEEITQYASDAQTIQQPQGTDYSQGVKAGRTIPAKWWNWLFSASTKRIVQARSDANNMLTELKNVVTDAGLTPTASDNTQLTQAVEAKADTQIDKFIEDKRQYLSGWQIEKAPFEPLTKNVDYIRRADLMTWCDVSMCDELQLVFSAQYSNDYASAVQLKGCIGTGPWFDIPYEPLPSGYKYNYDVIRVTPVHFNGYYFLAVTGGHMMSGDSMRTFGPKLYKIADNGAEDMFEVSLPVNPFASSSAASCAFKVRDKLYVMQGSSNTMYLFTSSDGINWSYISESGVNYSVGYTWPRASVAPITPVCYADKAVVGNVCIDTTTNTWTLLVGDSVIFGTDLGRKIYIGGGNGDYATYGLIRPHTLVAKLADGIVFLRPMYSNNLGFRAYSINTSTEEVTLAIEGVVYDMVVTTDGRYAVLRTSSTTYVTSDGLTFSELPSTHLLNSAISVGQLTTIGDKYYTAAYKTNLGYRLYVATDLDNWQDTGVRLTGVPETCFISSLGTNKAIFMCKYERYLVNDHYYLTTPAVISPLKLNLDTLSWESITPAFLSSIYDSNTKDGCTTVIFIVPANNVPSSVAPNVSAGVYIMRSTTGTNFVDGHTLYLR